jgi:predicted enzyme related to lactoylglutathione lyase
MDHPYGTFCFAELHTPDVERSTAFYTELFGWTVVPVPDSPGYFRFQLDGQDVIGMRQTPGPQRLLGCVNVASVDAAATQVQALGGRVEVPAADTRGIARTAVAADRDGALFGLWQSLGHAGAAVQDRTGSMWWCELLARDVRGARDFYTPLFGWRFELTPKFEVQDALGEGLTVFKAGETSAASALQYQPDWGVSPRWSVFFAIDEWKDTVRRASRLGGELGFWRDVPNAGRLGTLEDPLGATFVIVQPLKRS